MPDLKLSGYVVVEFDFSKPGPHGVAQTSFEFTIFLHLDAGIAGVHQCTQFPKALD